MNKKIKGYEVMKLIAEKQIKVAQGFLFTDADGVEEKIFWDGENFKYLAENSYVLRTVSDIEFVLGDFEILEDEEDIDIQGLEEPEIKSDGFTEYYEYYNGGVTESGYTKNYSLDDIQARKMIKQLIKCVKQLDKKINKED